MVLVRAGHAGNRLLSVAVVLVCLSVLLPTPVSAETAVGQGATWVRTAMDDAGNIHMVYANPWEYSYYTKFNGSSWSAPIVLPNSGGCWFDFTNPDIDVGPDGRPQVVYGINTGDYPNDLEYVFYAKANDANGTSWSMTTIGGDGFRRNHARIAVDENNIGHITYMKTNKYPGYWWEIIYRRPDGSEKVIQHTEPDSYRCNNPDIAYRDGIVHIAWYQGGSGTMTTNIMHAAGSPYSDFPVFEQLTNMPYKYFVGDPGVAVAPDGQVDIVYIIADFNPNPGIYKGVYSTRTGLVDGGWAYVNEEEREDWGPNITFMNDGTRFVVWSHFDNDETMYVRNSEPKVTMVPWGSIDVCAGNGGAYYVRCYGESGPMYYQQLEGGAPPNQPPVAQFTVTPESGDILTSFAFDASGSYDPDNNLPLTYKWDWDDDGDFDLVQVGVATATHMFPYPSTYGISLQVEDSQGGRGNASGDVEVINHAPTAVFEAEIVGPDSVMFDASMSIDLEDSTQLSYRWDWESDGTFDTQWRLSPQILNVFPGLGSYQVTLEVRDMLWSVGDTTALVQLLAPEPATGLQASIEPLDEGWAIALSWTPSPSTDVVSQTVQRSTDAQSWEDVSELAPEEAAYEDTLVQAGTFWYRIATANQYYESYSDSVEIETVGAEGTAGIPTTLTLERIRPNPASGSISLRIAIPSPGSAGITLHDLAGRIVAARSLAIRDAGWMEWRWDLSRDGVPAGMYVIKVAMDGASVASPVVIVR